MLQNVQSTQEAGMAFSRDAALGATGTSPRAATLTLPEQGVYIAEIHATRGDDNNNLAVVVASIVWYTFEDAGVNANTVAKTNLWGTPGYSAGPGSPTINSLTVSDPSTSGVVTITVGWSDTGTSRTPWATWTLHKLASKLDLRANGYAY